MKVIIRENLREDDINYLVQFKSCLDDYKRNFKVLVNEEEKNYLVKNNNAKILKEIKGVEI